jgi:hypothetical protein
MVKRYVGSSILGLLIACGPRATAKAPAEALRPIAHKAAPASYRAMVYSSALAERFALPKGGVQSLDAGLQAVVLRIVERAGEHPSCYLDLYVDDKLDLAFPEGSEGVAGRPDYENPFFFVRGAENLAAEDHRWNTQLGSFHSVGCRKTPNNCGVDEQSGPYAYSRRLIPGVALQTYAPLCSSLDPKNGPTEMWLLRAGRDAKDLNTASTDETATYRFAMPIALFEHAADRVRQAVNFHDDHPLVRQSPRGQFSVPGG